MSFKFKMSKLNLYVFLPNQQSYTYFFQYVQYHSSRRKFGCKTESVAMGLPQPCWAHMCVCSSCRCKYNHNNEAEFFVVENLSKN